MRTADDVGVVIPARHAAGTLADAVGSALAEGVWAIVIAVDPNDVETERCARDLAARHPGVRVVANPGGVTPVALNRGIALLDTAIVARLDAHARLDPGYIATSVGALDRTEAAVVGGRQRAVGDSRMGRAVAAAMASRAGSGGARHRIGGWAGPSETAYLGVFDREWLDRVGGYDDDLVRNQDYEICHRIRQAGGEVWFDPAMSATYIPRETWRGLAGQYHEFGRWKRRVMAAAPRSIRPRQLGPPLLVLGLAVSGAAAAAATIRQDRGGRRAALVLPTAYAAALAVAASRLTATSPPPLSMGERARAAGALAIMHGAWGAGFWRGGRRRTRRPVL